MEPQRCPLCQIRAEQGVLEHLRRDHRRTEAETRVLMERYRDETLGWNAEGRMGRSRRSQPPMAPSAGLRCGAILVCCPLPGALGAPKVPRAESLPSQFSLSAKATLRRESRKFAPSPARHA